ncbi:MAG: peptide chain release factor N(5)-glutamine methyltransferase [Chloroflexi bacterium]|nr:peptide chain release factor N(5)-glutamine methyltransferase [Chloroflexota bacterium]
MSSLPLGSTLRWGRDALRPSRTAALDAQLLLGHVLGRDRAWVLAHPDDSITRDQYDRFTVLIRRRARGEPVAYLRGFVEWYGLELEVTRDVLIPRPETELVVELAVQIARQYGASTLADIGTGSGAIAIALAGELPDARVFAVDPSERALDVARRNSELHGVAGRITFLHGYLTDPLPGAPDLLVANLPYLSDEMMASLDADVRHEPAAALHGGASGLELYAEMLEQLRERSWTIPVVLEIDPRQRNGIAEVAGRIFPGADVSISDDYAGLPRVVSITP